MIIIPGQSTELKNNDNKPSKDMAISSVSTESYQVSCPACPGAANGLAA